MKAKLLVDGKIYEAKYFKDMGFQEQIDSGGSPIDKSFEDNDIFLEPKSWGDGKITSEWQYMTDEEVEIIEDDTL